MQPSISGSASLLEDYQIPQRAPAIATDFFHKVLGDPWLISGRDGWDVLGRQAWEKGIRRLKPRLHKPSPPPRTQSNQGFQQPAWAGLLWIIATSVARVLIP